MSIRGELTVLRVKRESLQKGLWENGSKLSCLYEKKTSICKNAKCLMTRESPLAKTLLEKVRGELKKVEQEVAQVEEMRDAIRKEIDEVNQKVKEMESDFRFYVHEQVSLIISDFLRYIESHLEEIGLKITSTYRIMEVMERKNFRTQFYTIPTGKIGICEEKNRFITFSRDFYFEDSLYVLNRGEFDDVECKTSAWYNDYREYFITYLGEELQKRYTFKDLFKLTIENENITLELV